MIQQGYYKHYKGGIYQVIGTGKHSENLESVVIYRNAKNQTWVRPASMWNEKVSGVPRFQLIKDKREGRRLFLFAQKFYRDQLRQKQSSNT